MEEKNNCQKCGSSNRKGARYCLNCGAPLQNAPIKPNKPRTSGQGIANQVKLGALKLVKKLDDQLDVWLGAKSKPDTKSSDHNSPDKISPVQTATVALPRLPARSPGDQVGSYFLGRAWSLPRSNYYQAYQNQCPKGHIAPKSDGGRCSICQSKLPVYLLHEITADDSQEEIKRHQKTINSLRGGNPGILKPVEVFYQEQCRYLVAEYPFVSWSNLYNLTLPPADLDRIVKWCLNLGQAHVWLMEHSLAPDFTSIPELFETLLIIQDQAVYSDLAYFVEETEGGYGESKKIHLTHLHTAHIGQVLYTMASGRYQKMTRSPLDLSDIPLPFRRLVDRARRNEFSSLSEFLDMLNMALQVQASPRGLRQATGYATNTGRVRDHNEDFVGKYSLGMQQAADMPEVGLYIVADGMGGHQAGELASSQVVREVLDQVQQQFQVLQAVPRVKRQTVKLDELITPGEALEGAIQRANNVLYNARQQIGTDRGTTITAALLVGDLCSIANVGDSRTYLFHNGKLEQVSQDHSLVASLVAANLIQPGEVRGHPQRSSILRSLGEQSKVDVDLFQRQLATGDRLLLCSDGLWEMVLDSDMEKILRQAPSPQATCDRLIEAANLGGGEDNISAIVVWIE